MIQLRFVVRDEMQTHLDGSKVFLPERVLQYRTAPEPKIGDNPHWGEWQDVPVVNE